MLAHAVRALIAARKKLVGQRLAIENQIRGLVIVFGEGLPGGKTSALQNRVLELDEGVPGLSSVLHGLIDARDAIKSAIAGIDWDVQAMVRSSEACRLLMAVPAVGPITALAFTAGIDDPARFCRSRDVGAYFGLVPRRHPSGEIDYTGSISKRGDTRVRTLLYEAANVILTRTKQKFVVKIWARGVATRSSMRKARVALARRLAIMMHAMLRDQTTFRSA